MKVRKKKKMNSEFDYKIKADLVIKSLGFDPEDLPHLLMKDNLSNF